MVGEVWGHGWYGITLGQVGQNRRGQRRNAGVLRLAALAQDDGEWKRSGAVEDEGEQRLGDAVGVVAEEVAFEGEVAGDGFDAEGKDAVEVGLDGCLATAGVAFEEGGRDGGGVDEGVVEDARAVYAAVLEDFFDVLGCSEAERLVGLGHEVADVDAGGVGCGEGLGDSAYQEVGDERGV